MTSKNLANLRISQELFRQMLDLPEDTNILAASIDILHWGVLVITIENPELPKIEEGERIPDSMPMYQTEYAEDGSVIKITRIDWGIR